MSGVAGAVVITGCSSGIGRAIAKRLAADGHVVYATARDLSSIDDLIEIGCKALQLDVTDEQSAARAITDVEAAEGSVAVLVNNAGFGQSGAVEAVSVEAVRAQFETNVLGYVRLAQLALPGMRRAGAGRIINISSVAGRVTMPGSGVYSASKFAIEALSDALRFEVKGFGIDVVLIEPGPIRTAFTATASSLMPAPDGAYDAFHLAVATGDAETDASWLAGTAEQVAAVVSSAIMARQPRTRYRVTFAAWLLPILRRVLTDRAWDAFLATQIPHPKGHVR